MIWSGCWPSFRPQSTKPESQRRYCWSGWSRLRERRAAGEITALVVDEAQSLSVELLEEIRLLANIETPTIKLLPLILSGQPELRRRLDAPELRQLKQRVTLRGAAPFELRRRRLT